ERAEKRRTVLEWPDARARPKRSRAARSRRELPSEDFFRQLDGERPGAGGNLGRSFLNLGADLAGRRPDEGCRRLLRPRELGFELRQALCAQSFPGPQGVPPRLRQPALGFGDRPFELLQALLVNLGRFALFPFPLRQDRAQRAEEKP